MPSYVVSAAGEPIQQIQQIQQLNNQIQQLNQNQQAMESQLNQVQQLAPQIHQLTLRFEQMIVDTGSIISTMQSRLASLETGQPDRVVLFELKERVAQFEGEKEREKEKEKNGESRVRRKIRLSPSLPTTISTIPEQERGYHAPTVSSAAPS